MIKVSGDFAALADMRRRLAKLGQTNREIVREFESVAVRELDRTFGRRQSPYGRRWKARKTRRSNPLLEETGALRGSVTGHRKGALGFGVKYTDHKAAWHHNGTSRGIDARRLVPFSGRLPAKWKKRFQVVFKRRMRAALGF